MINRSSAAEKAVLNLSQLSKMTELLENFSYLMYQNDLQIKAYSEDSLKLLKTFGVEKIEGIYKNFKAFADVCEKVASDKVDIRDNVAFVKCGLKHLSLTAPTTFFDKVAADDLIEIYDLAGVQIFRNLRFFEITNYSLGDLLTFPWGELYERSSIITEKMSEDVASILNSGENILAMRVPVHVIKEIRINPIQVCEVRFKNISPCYDSNGVKSGFIVSCQARSLRDAIAPQGLDFI